MTLKATIREALSSPVDMRRRRVHWFVTSVEVDSPDTVYVTDATSIAEFWRMVIHKNEFPKRVIYDTRFVRRVQYGFINEICSGVIQRKRRVAADDVDDCCRIVVLSLRSPDLYKLDARRVDVHHAKRMK